MGVSAKIYVVCLMISVAASIPAGKTRETLQHNEDTRDLNAESSEIVPKAVAPPADHAASATGYTDQSVNPGLQDHSIELLGGSQNFFPSFANLFESRPQNNLRLFGSQETAYSQRPNSYRSLLNYPNLFGSYRNLDSFGKSNTPAAAPVADASSSVLGSGNFGIIRGGTFFAQNDEESDYNDGFSFYNNGHGKPSHGLGYVANPRPNYNQDQFANFRDFADINSPNSNSAYSHFVVVYANKNATMDEISEETRKVTSEPKNIFETLELLDVKSPPKVSKSKAKLEATKKLLNKREQWKKANAKSLSQKHEVDEPLLALS